MRKPTTGGLVYSTDGGRMCPLCRLPLASCRCAVQPAATPAAEAVVRVSRETKGRGGKAVTVVRGLNLESAALAALGKRLRGACGAGGTQKEGAIEIQGDHAERAVAWLVAQGWAAKRSGG